MMSIALITAYAATGLVFLAHSLYYIADRRRERWLRAADLVILGAVAVVSSAAWIVFLPVLAAGWVRSAEGHRRLERVRSSAGSRGQEVDSVTVGC